MQPSSSANELFENLRLELRRGSLILAVLAALRSEQYGYTLRKSLADQGMEIDEGTLYPLLRRLESQGLLTSEWREEEKRNKRFYRLAPRGEEILKQLLAEWEAIGASLEEILKEPRHATAG
ncbi:MAG TPA: helix-turn-helix transcriptional regulator [Candidatus Binatia bacterium]|nr:helix-turn-helix transcriptional regulator [Candidatus Binatia bacterium]